MKFTLTYRGELKSKGDSRERQKIRNALSGQHERLWQHENFSLDKSSLSESQVGRAFHARQFLPLISRSGGLRVSLDVLKRPRFCAAPIRVAALG